MFEKRKSFMFLLKDLPIIESQDLCWCVTNQTCLYLSLSQLTEKLKMQTDQGVQLGEETVQQLRLHVQVVGHPLAEHLLDHLQQLTVMLLCDDELVDMFLTLGFMRLQCRGHAFRNRSSPGLGFLSLNPQERISFEISQRYRETIRKLLGWKKFCIK